MSKEEILLLSGLSVLAQGGCSGGTMGDELDDELEELAEVEVDLGQEG
jgi:hypothetical protein